MYVESTFQTVCLLPDTAIPVRLVSISYSNLPQDHIVLERVCCLLVLNLVSSTLSCQPSYWTVIYHRTTLSWNVSNWTRVCVCVCVCVCLCVCVCIDPQDHIVLKCLKLNSTPCVQCGLCGKVNVSCSPRWATEHALKYLPVAGGSPEKSTFHKVLRWKDFSECVPTPRHSYPVLGFAWDVRHTVCHQ
jgi:hypothetical protein